jgi:anti-sigma B factor antagonist
VRNGSWIRATIAGMDFYYHEIDKDVLILSADGGLNADTGKAFVDQLAVLVDQGLGKIIVDCTHLDYISSFGIGVLIRLHSKLAARGGDVKIASAKSMVLKALQVVRLNRLVDIYPDVNAARLAFRPKDPAK